MVFCVGDSLSALVGDFTRRYERSMSFERGLRGFLRGCLSESHRIYNEGMLRGFQGCFCWRGFDGVFWRVVQMCCIAVNHKFVNHFYTIRKRLKIMPGNSSHFESHLILHESTESFEQSKLY